jgi:sugar phosphate isomerase/epimerase
MKSKIYAVTISLSMVIGLLLFQGCNNAASKNKTEDAPPFFKISLAQWSIHKMIRSEAVSPYEFAALAKKWGFEGLEYVNQLYPDVMNSEDKAAALENFVNQNNALAAEHGVQNVLIMIDSEGDLAASDAEVRAQAIANHKMWIEAASKMGCSSVRLNLFGEKDPQKWVGNSIASMTELCTFAKPLGINVIVENHGRISSRVPLLMEVINGVAMDNCGTLPDFGNFCISDEGYGSIFDGSCDEVYDIYKGVDEMLKAAFGVSAKSYVFDAEGNERNIDYKKMLQIVKNNNYSGVIGVEFEGDELSEEEGILATKALLIEAAKGI